MPLAGLAAALLSAVTGAETGVRLDARDRPLVALGGRSGLYFVAYESGAVVRSNGSSIQLTCSVAEPSSNAALAARLFNDLETSRTEYIVNVVAQHESRTSLVVR